MEKKQYVTKEQEREALAKIKAIGESLGEDSYIGTAFEGVFEIAEENIADDAAYSMKERAESAEQTVVGLERHIKALEAQAVDLMEEWDFIQEAARSTAHSNVELREENERLRAEVAALQDGIATERDNVAAVVQQLNNLAMLFKAEQRKGAGA